MTKRKRNRAQRPETLPVEALSPEPRLLTKQQCAEFLQVTVRTLEAWMAKGLPYYKLGSRRCRFDRAQVQRYLDEKCAVVRAA